MIYQKCPFKGQLSLAGHAQSSVPEELSFYFGHDRHKLHDLSYVFEIFGSGGDKIWLTWLFVKKCGILNC